MIQLNCTAIRYNVHGDILIQERKAGHNIFLEKRQKSVSLNRASKQTEANVRSVQA